MASPKPTAALLFAATLVTAPIRAAEPPADAAYRVVVHPSNPTVQLSVTEISDLFLKKTTSWADGQPVEPVDLTPASPIRHAFSEDVHDRSAASIRSYWQQIIFSGKGVPPAEMSDDREVVSFVAGNRGAIGYVSANAALAGVRALSVVRPPERIHYVPPVYPEKARLLKREGIVVLDVVIDRDGSVAEVIPLTELEMGLTQAAVRAVERWRFRPPTIDGQPTRATFRLKVNFELP